MGRGHETFGEAPYLTGRLGVRYIMGLQGHDEKYLKTLYNIFYYQSQHAISYVFW